MRARAERAAVEMSERCHTVPEEGLVQLGDTTGCPMPDIG